MVRVVVCLLFVAACGGSLRVPSPPPSLAPEPSVAVPSGPVVYEPQRLILPPEQLAVPVERVAIDRAVPGRGWERQFVLSPVSDFRWFAVTVYVLEPDVTPERFIGTHACGSIAWTGEDARPQALPPPSGSASADACRYTFGDGERVLYVTTGYRNVGIVVGTQPRSAAVSDELAIQWSAALARMQVALVKDVIARSGARP